MMGGFGNMGGMRNMGGFGQMGNFGGMMQGMGGFDNDFF